MSDSTALPRLPVEIWSDVVCPWCWIGKRRFEKAVALVEEIVEVDVCWRPYQLDRRATEEPRPLIEVYARKFGGVEQAQEILDGVRRIAASEGLVYDFDAGQVRVTTLPAHRLIWLAEQEGDQAAVVEALFAAHFTEGRNVALPETLLAAGAAGGVSEARVLAMLDGDEGAVEVLADMARAEDLLVTGVPTFLIGGRWPVPGAQDVATFERVLRRLAEVADEA